MRRVAVTLAVFAALVAATVAALLATDGSASLKQGRGLYVYRSLLEAELETARSADVVWLGDSTIMSFGSRRGYPDLLSERVLGRRGRRSAVIALPALDFFGYYALMGPAVATRPRVVVLIANLLMLDPRGMDPRPDLVSFVPVRELWRLLALPYAIRGMSAPDLLLARLLRFDPLATTMYLVAGARRRAADAEWWAVLGPKLPAREDWTWWAKHEHDLLPYLRQYARPVGPGHPMLQFAGASVEMAIRSGAHVVVVVSPMPLDALGARGMLDRDRVAATIATLRSVVEAAGGTVVDLHAALPRAELADAYAHFTPAGTDHMAELVRLPIAAALGDPELAAEAQAARVDARPADQTTPVGAVSR